MTHGDIAWNKLPLEIKQNAVARLKAIYEPSFFEEIAKLANEKGLGEWLPMGWHFTQGMDVRNALRSDQVARNILGATSPPCWWKPWVRNIRTYPGPIKDEELPGLPEVYGEDVSSWDDFYIQVIEAAAGLRT